MLGTYFYHERIRKTVALFGSLFTKIHVMRTTSAGASINQVRVPLSYAPRSKFLARLEQVENLPGDETVAIKLPRMSFEMTAVVDRSAFEKNLEIIQPVVSLAGVESTITIPSITSHKLLSPE